MHTLGKDISSKPLFIGLANPSKNKNSQSLDEKRNKQSIFPVDKLYTEHLSMSDSIIHGSRVHKRADARP